MLLPNLSPTFAIVRVYRLARAFLHIIYGMALMIVAFPFFNQQQRSNCIRIWSKGITNVFNVEVTTSGEIPVEGGMMFVANHVSWLDIHALNSVKNMRFIAKSDIRHWPFIGFLASRANTLFIDRGKRQDTAKTISVISQSLENGDAMCFFPEGTTTDGRELKPFKGSLLQGAVEGNKDVVPVSIFYPDASNSANTRMAYFGEMTLLESLLNVVSQKRPQVHLHFYPPIKAGAYNRRELSLLIQDIIAEGLKLPSPKISSVEAAADTQDYDALQNQVPHTAK